MWDPAKDIKNFAINEESDEILAEDFSSLEELVDVPEEELILENEHASSVTVDPALDGLGQYLKDAARFQLITTEDEFRLAGAIEVKEKLDKVLLTISRDKNGMPNQQELILALYKRCQDDWEILDDLCEQKRYCSSGFGPNFTGAQS